MIVETESENSDKPQIRLFIAASTTTTTTTKSQKEEKVFLKDVIYCVFIIDIYGFYSSLFYGECDARWYLCTGASRKFLHPKKKNF